MMLSIEHDNTDFTQRLHSMHGAFRVLSDIQAILTRPSFSNFMVTNLKYGLEVAAEPDTKDAPFTYANVLLWPWPVMDKRPAPSSDGSGSQQSGPEFLCKKVWPKGRPMNLVGDSAHLLGEIIEEGLNELMARGKVFVDLRVTSSNSEESDVDW